MASAIRSRFALVALSASAAAGLAVSVLPTSSAYADPHLTLQQAKAKVASLQSQADVATEHYNQARLAVQAAQVSAQRAQADVSRQQDNVTREQRALASLAASEYRTGGADQIVTLVTTKDPQAYIEQSTFENQFARSRTQALSAMKTARKRLETLQQTAKAQITAAQSLERQAAENKSKVDDILAEQNRVVDNLTAAARQQYLAAQAAEKAQAQHQAAVASVYRGQASGRAAAALQAAYAQMGKPYVYGGAGPNSFDCSGLTAWAYAAAGVSLPHSAAAQYNYGMHVSYAELQPGDLVFFDEGGYIGHVGIYVGNGNMIDAPHTGSYVGVRALYPGFVGGTRL